MQIYINDNLYQQLSDYASRVHVKAENILEEAVTKYFLDIMPNKRRKWLKKLSFGELIDQSPLKGIDLDITRDKAVNDHRQLDFS